MKLFISQDVSRLPKSEDPYTKLLEKEKIFMAFSQIINNTIDARNIEHFPKNIFKVLFKS